MAKYDETDYRPPLPGGTVPPAGTGAAGTRPQQPREMSGVDVVVTAPGGRPTDDMVNVDCADVLVPSQEGTYGVDGQELISGVGGIGQTGAGKGRVWAPRAGS